MPDVDETLDQDKPFCGIIMPISGVDEDYTEEHWKDVLAILSEVIVTAGFKPNLVSSASETGIIQARIVQNLYDYPILICDVSTKNPNVMFELGMRIAFDKHAVIIKDDDTTRIFDIEPIEYLEYSRTLRHPNIEKFKKELAEKLHATYETSKTDPNPYLRHFGRKKGSSS